MQAKEEGESNILFRTTDPAKREVICKRDYYFDHICRDAKGRQYLEESEEIAEFKRTIENPDKTYGYSRDRDYPNRIVYMTIHKSGDYYNRVVVEFANKNFEGVGIVTTAFQPTNVREGDKPLWLEQMN